MKFKRRLERAQARAFDAEQERRCDLLEAWLRNEQRLPPLAMAPWLGELAHSAARHGGIGPGSVMERNWPATVSWVRLMLQAWGELSEAAEQKRGAKTDSAHHALVYLAAAESWAQAGYPRVRLDDQMAGALCLTDSSGAELENVMPWPAFVITAPSRTLTISLDAQQTQWVESVLVQQLEHSADKGGISVTLVPEGGGWPMMIAVGETLDELLAARELWERHAVICEMAVNLVRGVLLQIQSGKLQKVAATRPRGPSNRWREPGELPTTTDYVLGADVKLRPENDYALAARMVADGTERVFKVQWMVRGHQRWQACGPRHSERKLIWILPHMKGRADAPMLRRDHVIEVDQ